VIGLITHAVSWPSASIPTSWLLLVLVLVLPLLTARFGTANFLS